MNKLIIGDTEFELVEMGVCGEGSTPHVSYNNRYYVGKAIQNTLKDKPKSFKILERYDYGEVPCDGDIAPIKSVKRLSDNDVFAVDEITEQGKITKFKVSGNSVLVSVLCRDQYEYFLEDLRKNQHKYYEIMSIYDGNSLVHDAVVISNFKNEDNRYTDFSIRSVKRLSDGTVLSQGDSITWVTRQDIPVDTIKGIEWQLGQNKPFFHLESGGGCYGDYLKKVKKEKPISYEILKIISHGDEVRKLIDGLYRLFEDGVGFELGYLLNRTDTSIKTIKRLSDGEIFTIGDKVERMDDNDSIDAFILNYKGNDMWVSTDMKNGYGSSLEYAKKAKKLILTTEDGVDVYEGDRVWFVTPSRNYEIEKYDLIKSDPSDELKAYHDIHKYFSTREAADNYVLMNKPCLSLNDLLDSWDDYPTDDKFNREYYSDAPLFLKFKNAAKNKINVK